jgi:glucokinase
VTTPPVLAADVGGTQMGAALVDARGAVLQRDSAATPGEADVPAALLDLIQSVGAEDGHGMVAHAVVGLPGGIDYGAGRLLWALPAQWTEALSRDELSARLGLAVHIANDAELGAVGEATFGAGDAGN